MRVVLLPRPALHGGRGPAHAQSAISRPSLQEFRRLH